MLAQSACWLAAGLLMIVISQREVLGRRLSHHRPDPTTPTRGEVAPSTWQAPVLISIRT